MKDKQRLVEQVAEKLGYTEMQVIFLAVRDSHSSSLADREVASIAVGVHFDYTENRSIPEYAYDWALNVLAGKITDTELPTIVRRRTYASQTH